MMKCSVCNKNLKSKSLVCGICETDICKNCAEFLSEDSFHYVEVKPVKNDSSCFCQTCYTTDVLPLINNYEETLAKAREVRIFSKSQAKETRLIKKLEEPIVIENGLDEPDVLLKMAYKAAARDFNSIVDVEVKSKKVRTGSYQTSTWSGTGIPVNVDDAKLVKDRSIRDNPN